VRLRLTEHPFNAVQRKIKALVILRIISNADEYCANPVYMCVCVCVCVSAYILYKGC